MKSTSLLVLIACLTQVLFSCQKEAEGTITGSTQTSDSVLSKMIMLDTNIPSGTDTLFVNDILYDANKRPAHQIQYIYALPPATGVAAVADVQYYYTGTQVLPDSCHANYTDYVNPGNNSLGREFWWYQNDWVVKDSSSEWGLSNARTFTKLSPNRYRISGVYYLPGGGKTYDTVFCNMIWSAGNLLHEVDSSRDVVTGNWIVETTDMTYDTHTNVYKGLVIPYPTPGNHDVGTPGAIDGYPCTNNYSVYTDFNGTETYTLQYSPAGLVSRLASDGEKILYFYKKR